MGMDVNGKNPDSKVGEYFRNNCWYWRPLARYCCEVAPAITAACTYWQSNDGDGLDAEGSKALAAELRKRLDSGEVEAYAKDRQAKLDALPMHRCDLCDGTGKRTDMEVEDGCNACHGTGKVKDNETWYPFDVDNVKEFAEFLEHCGGFEIC